MTATATFSSDPSRRGAVLVWIILTMVLLSVLGVSVIQVASTARQTHFTGTGAPQARFYAEAGVAYAQHIHCTDVWADGLEQTLQPDPSATVTLSRSGDTWTATARAFIGSAMDSRATVSAPVRDCDSGGPDDESSAGDFVITATGDFQTQGIRVDGDIAVIGDDFKIQKGGDGIIEGNVYAEEGIELTGNGTVVGDLYTDGDVEIKQGFIGTAANHTEIHAGGSVEAAGSSIVHGTVYAGESFEATGSSTFYGDIHACAGEIEIGGSTTVIGNLYARDSIEISGGATVIGSLHSMEGDIEINVPIDGDAYAAGSIELGNRNALFISGDAHAGESIEMGNKARIGGDAYAGISIERPGNVGGIACAPCSPDPPVPPTCPQTYDFASLESPPPTTFTAGSDDYGNDAYREVLSLAPGSYGEINLNGSESILRLESGTYTFSDIELGWQGRIVLDISSGQEVRLFLTGDFKTGGELQIYLNLTGLPGDEVRALDRDNETSLVEETLAELIYLEAHGEIDIGGASEWFGSLHAPYDELRIGQHSMVVGAIFGNDDIRVQGVTIKWVPPLYFQ
jgi:cytoskeletal protein CcmA (bactofilin family)